VADNTIRVHIVGDEDVSGAVDKAIAKLKELQDRKVKIDIDVNADKVNSKLSAIEKRIKELGGKVDIDLDTGAARAKLNYLHERLRELGKNTASIDLDTGAARAKITELKSQLKGISDETINIDLDSGGALAELAELKALLKGIDSESIEVDIDAAKAYASLAELIAFIQALPCFEICIKVDQKRLLSSLASAIPDTANDKVKLDVDRNHLRDQLDAALGREPLSPLGRAQDDDRLRRMGEALRNLGNSSRDVDKASDSVKDLGDNSSESSDKVDKLNSSMKNNTTSSKRVTNSLKDMGRAYAETNRRIQESDEDHNRVSRTMRSTMSAMSRMPQVLGAVGGVMTQAFSSMSRSIPVLGGMFNAFNRVTQSMVQMGGSVGTLGKIAGPIGAIATAGVAAYGALTVLGTVGVLGTGALTAGLYATQAAMGAVAGGAGLLSGAVGGAVAGSFVYFAAQNEEVQKALDGTVSHIGTAMKDISTAAVGPSLIRFADTAKTSFDSMLPSVNRMAEGTGKLVDQLGSKLPPVAQKLGPMLETAFESGSKHLNSLMDAMPNIVQGFDNLFASLGSPAVVQAASTAFNALPGMITAVGNAVEWTSGKFNELNTFMSSDRIAPLREGWQQFTQELGKTDWSPAIQGITDAVNAFGSFMGSIDGADIAGTIEGITGAFEGLTRIAENIDLVGAFNNIAQTIDATIGGIENVTKAFKITLSPVFELIGGGLNFDTILAGIQGIASPSMAIKVMANLIWEVSKDGLGSLLDNIKSFLGIDTVPPQPVTVKIDPTFIINDSKSVAEAKARLEALTASLEAQGKEVRIQVTPQLIMTELNSKGHQFIGTDLQVPIKGNITDVIMPNLGLEPVKLPVNLDPKVTDLSSIITGALQGAPTATVPIKGMLGEIVGAPIEPPPVPVKGQLNDIITGNFAGGVGPTVPIKGMLGEIVGAPVNLPPVPVDGKLSGLITGALSGANVPPVEVNGKLGEIQGTAAPIEVPAIPIFDANGIKVGEISVPVKAAGPPVVPPPAPVQVPLIPGPMPPPASPGPVQVPLIPGPLTGAPTYNGAPVQIPSVLGPPLTTNIPPKLPPVEQPVTPKFDGLFASPPKLPPIEQPVVMKKEGGFDKVRAEKLPPITQEVRLGPIPVPPPVRIPIVPDIGAFMGVLGALSAGMAAAPVRIPIIPDTAAFGVALGALTAGMAMSPVRIPVVPDLAAFGMALGMLSALPPIRVPVIPDFAAFAMAGAGMMMAPIRVPVIPDFAAAMMVMPQLPPIHVPVVFDIPPINIQVPAVHVNVTSNAAEVAAQVASIPTSVNTQHTVDTNVDTVMGRIQSLNGLHTSSTHTVVVSVTGPGAALLGGAAAPTRLMGGDNLKFGGADLGLANMSPLNSIAGAAGIMGESSVMGMTAPGSSTGLSGASGLTGGSTLSISNSQMNSIITNWSDIGASIGIGFSDGLASSHSMIQQGLYELTNVLNSGLINFTGDLFNWDSLGKATNLMSKEIANGIKYYAPTTMRRAATGFNIFDMFSFEIGSGSLQRFIDNIFSGRGRLQVPRKVASGSLDGTGQMIVYNNYQTINNQFDGGLVGDPERQAKRVLEVLEQGASPRRINSVLAIGN
jgi:methyl-accepting chemotaxis protein